MCGVHVHYEPKSEDRRGDLSSEEVVTMEYKFVRTMSGPAVVGDDEVLFFSQVVPLQDYVDSDPEFLTKAKMFVSEAIVDLAETLATSLHTAVVGVDYAMSLPTYVTAIHHLATLEKFISQQQAR
jgi:hypothetical protein